ncbi:MAG: MolR family transcriptional regulator, partial [Desulfurococcales archaeon]|nr:MolR family transcriptional regulator [Desulfurococcales archaeon]
RLLLEQIISKESEKRRLNLDTIRNNIRGYRDKVYTHIDVVRKIASGEADIGIAIKWVAETYKLPFIHITWEDFDFITRADKVESKKIKEFINTLRSREFKEILDEFSGYKLCKDMGSIIYIK